MPEDLLNLIKRSAAVDQKRCVLMAQIVDTQVGQTRLGAQPRPNLHDRRIGLLRLFVDEKVFVLALGVQLLYHIQRAVVQGYRANALTFAIDRFNT